MSQRAQILCCGSGIYIKHFYAHGSLRWRGIWRNYKKPKARWRAGWRSWSALACRHSNKQHKEQRRFSTGKTKSK